MDALTFDDLPSAGSTAKLSAPLTFDDIESGDEGGILSSIGNIGRGIGERAATLGGGLIRGVATAIEPAGDWLQRNVGDLVQEADGSITWRRLTEEEAAQPSSVLSIGQKTAKALEDIKLGYEQGTSWEDVKQSPIKKFIPFVLEQGLVSVPDMVAAAANLPAYIAARTGEMGQERAENNNLDNATAEDLMAVLPGAVLSSMLERLGARGFLADTAVTAAKQLPKAIRKAALKEGVTEAGQELIEYGSTNIGTAAGFDPAEAGERMAAGAVGGAGFGGIARAATAGVETATGRGRSPDIAEVDAAGDPADVLYGADPIAETPADVLPQQEAAARLQSANADPERLSSPRLTPEDRSSPLPNALIDDGKAIIDRALASPQEAPAASETAQPLSAPASQPRALASPQEAPAASETAQPLSAPASQPRALASPQEAPAASETAQPLSAPASQPQATPAPSVRSEAVTFDDIQPSPAATGAVNTPAVQQPSVPTASWVIRDKATGEVVMETFERSTVERINTAKYEAVPIQEHLAQVNDPSSLAGTFARREGPAAPQVSPPPATALQTPPKSSPAPRMTPDGFPADRAGNVMKPKSLIEFLIDRGGIRDQGGDIRAAAAGRGNAQFAKGFGSLIRKNGLKLDEARKLAVEAGYLVDRGAGSVKPSESYISDLLDAIDQDARSGRQLFSFADANQAMRWQEEQRIKQDLDRYGSEEEFQAQEAMERALDEVAALTDRGRADPFVVDITTVMAQKGVDFDTAAIEVERRYEAEDLASGRNAPPQITDSLKDIPFFDEDGGAVSTARTVDDGRFPGDAEAEADAGAVYARSTGTGGPVDQGQGPRSEGGAETVVGRVQEAGRVQADDGRGQQEARRAEVTTEPGADGKPQTVIPGAEQISQREQAQRKADAKLKPKVEQQDAGGLFGDDVNSPQLFDQPAPKASDDAEPKFSAPDRGNFTAQFMAALSEQDEVFQYPRSKATSIEDTFADIDPTIEFVGEIDLDADDNQFDVSRKILLRSAAGDDFLVFERDGTGGDKSEVWIDVSNLEEGGGGSAIYAAIGNYAHNTGKVFIGDPAGLSDVALRRRTDAMLSSALKFGTTQHLEPHPRQIEGDKDLGIPPLKWTEGDDLGNVQRMIEVSVASTQAALPEISRARYDFKDRTFRSSKGERISDGMLRAWSASPRMRKASIGSASAKRVILLNSLLRSEGGERPRLLEQVLRQSRQYVSTGGLDRVLYGLTGDLTSEFSSDINALTADLRRRLDKLGLTEVGLRMSPIIEGYANGERFTADGSYFRGLIEVSLSAPDKVATLNHEAIHALKNLRLFNKSEWSILSSRSERDWIPSYGVEKAYEGSSQEVMIEEGIASAYVDWAEGKQMAGLVSRLFQRVKDFIAALGNALRGRGFDSVGMIFERIDSGEIGSRGLFRNDPDAKGDKRFSLTEEPQTAQDKQKVMQGFIARGQPIDRAIRLPFEVFGGITKDGVWKPSIGVNAKLGYSGRLGLGFGGVLGASIGSVAGGPVGAVVGGIAGSTAGIALLRANISPKGRFGWMHPFAENARRGLVDRYGLSDEYAAIDMARKVDQRKVMQQAQDILQVLQNASVGPQEAKVLQAVLTGENVTDTDMMKVAAPIRAAIDELGAEAVSLGLISAESFERNRGAYLHRVYQKNEMDQNGVIAWVGKVMGRNRVKIMGNQLKGRGLFWDVPVERLMADAPGWVEGESGGPVMGQKFRVLDYVPGTSTDMLSGESREMTTKRRAYLPADKPLPEKFTGPEWQDRGTWEVRATGKNKATIWRDYTKEERTKMGEILDARYTIAKTFMLMANDLSTGRFYKQVAENEEWAQKQQPATEWREAADYGRFWNDPNIGWVRVPETTIANSGGKKRYGALSGMFVRAEIWRDLNEVDQMQQSGLWRTVLTQWKINKTARSPVTHMNNIMSNMMFMDLGDVRMQDLVAGVKAFASGSADYIEARDAGAFGSDMISQEIRRDVLQPILDEIAKTGTDGKNPLLARMGAVGTVADKIWTWAKAADDRMLQAYQLEDEVFRMATYMRRRSLGDSVEAAARNAREQFLDYDIRAPWVNAARNSVLPFISYSYRVIPKIAENISNRPWKLAKYFALAYAANALAYAWDDGDDGEERERASLRDEEQGWTWLGVPRMLRMPYRDADGMPVFLDIRRWIPSGDVFDTNQGQSAIPVPSSLQLGGPLLLAFEFALNKQAFTGNEITNELTDTPGDKVAKVGDWLWKSWMPSAAWVPNSWYWEKIENAAKGAEDYSGRKYSLLEASLSSIGIKLKPQNVEDGLGWKQRAFEEVERALRTEARRLANRRERGLISESEFNKGMAELTEKFANLGEKAKDLGERAQKKPAN